MNKRSMLSRVTRPHSQISIDQQTSALSYLQNIDETTQGPAYTLSASASQSGSESGAKSTMELEFDVLRFKIEPAMVA